MLFSDRSVWTMVHGIGLSGAALMGLFAALFCLRAMASARANDATPAQARYFSWLVTGTAIALWASVLVGTFVIFPTSTCPGSRPCWPPRPRLSACDIRPRC